MSRSLGSGIAVLPAAPPVGSNTTSFFHQPFFVCRSLGSGTAVLPAVPSQLRYAFCSSICLSMKT
eukprot:8956455-Karenia_brevis.AAC.1